MTELAEHVHWVGVNDHVTELFEGIWPLPKGIRYNSYLISGEENILIDTVKTGFENILLENIAQYCKPENLDYIIVNHMEPDHSGALPLLRNVAPQATIVGTKKAKAFLKEFYNLTDNVKTVKTGDKITAGSINLKFFETPFLHWPETMMTLLPKDKILFSGDAFGSFGADEGRYFDDEIEVDDFQSEALRYFSNIVGMYTAPVQSALDRLKDLDFETIAPSHGPIWRSTPNQVVDMYRQWSKMEGEPGVTVISGSMYGNTRRLTQRVTRGIQRAGCNNFNLLDASRTHSSYLLSEVWKRKGVIIGSPTYDAGIFPPVKNLISLLEKKRLKNRYVGLVGSYGWAGGSIRKLSKFSKQLDWELVEPTIEFNGRPSSQQLDRAAKLGKNIAQIVTQ